MRRLRGTMGGGKANRAPLVAFCSAPDRLVMARQVIGIFPLAWKGDKVSDATEDGRQGTHRLPLR